MSVVDIENSQIRTNRNWRFAQLQCLGAYCKVTTSIRFANKITSIQRFTSKANLTWFMIKMDSRNFGTSCCSKMKTHNYNTKFTNRSDKWLTWFTKNLCNFKQSKPSSNELAYFVNQIGLSDYKTKHFMISREFAWFVWL